MSLPNLIILFQSFYEGDTLFVCSKSPLSDPLICISISLNHIPGLGKKQTAVERG